MRTRIIVPVLSTLIFMTSMVAVAQAGPSAGTLSQSATQAGCFDAFNVTAPMCETEQVRSLINATSLTVTTGDDFLYATAADTGAIVSFKRNAVNGGVTAVKGENGCIEAKNGGIGGAADCVRMPGDELLQPLDLVTSPDIESRNVFAVAGKGAGTVVALRRNAVTGALSENNCISSDASMAKCAVVQPFRNGAFQPKAIAIDPSGRFVYVGSSNGGMDGSITIFRVENNGGLIQLQGSDGCIANAANQLGIQANDCKFVNSIASVNDLTVSPDGRHLYVASGSGASTVTAFSIGKGGELTPLDQGGSGECIDSNGIVPHCTKSTLDGALGQPQSVAVSSNGKQVLVASSELNGLVSLKRETNQNSPRFGQLSELPVNSEGCWSSGNGGAVAAGCKTATEIDNPTGIATTRDGSLYVSSKGSSAVAEFSLDNATGMLRQLPQPDSCVMDQLANRGCQVLGRAMSRPVGLIASNDQRYVYALGNLPVILRPDGEPCPPIFLCDGRATPAGQIAAFQRATAPTCADRQLSVKAGEKVDVKLECSDSDGDILTLKTTSQPSHGSLGSIGQKTQIVSYQSQAAQPDGSCLNTGGGGLFVTSYDVTFTYQASDGENDSNNATVTITVNCTPEDPTTTPTPSPNPPDTVTSSTVITQAAAPGETTPSEIEMPSVVAVKRPEARCALVASISSVSKWKYLTGKTAVRLRTVAGGTFIRTRKQGTITVDHRGLSRTSSVAKRAVFFLDGKKIATKRGKLLRLAINPSKLSVGHHLAKVQVSTVTGRKITVTRTFVVRDCRPTRFTASLSSLLRRAHPDLRLWVHSDGGALTNAKFKLASQVKINKAKLEQLRGKVIGKLVIKADGAASVVSKLTVPRKIRGKSIALDSRVTLSLAGTPSLSVNKLPSNASEVTVNLRGKKTRLFRNVDSCAKLKFAAQLSDATSKLRLEVSRRLCSNRR